MNLFKGLLFLHGHFVRLEDIEPVCAEAAPSATPDLPAQLQFLDGRPLHAGHNFDEEETFEPLPAPQRELANCR